MRLLRIDHVSLDVHDRARSIAWYQEILGLTGAAPHAAVPPGQPVFLGAPRARLGLFQERGPGLRHVALATDRAGQEQVRERLERLGIASVRERHRDHDSLYVRDPDGVTLEVMVPTA